MVFIFKILLIPLCAPCCFIAILNKHCYSLQLCYLFAHRCLYSCYWSWLLHFVPNNLYIDLFAKFLLLVKEVNRFSFTLYVGTDFFARKYHFLWNPELHIPFKMEETTRFRTYALVSFYNRQSRISCFCRLHTKPQPNGPW